MVCTPNHHYTLHGLDAVDFVQGITSAFFCDKAVNISEDEQTRRLSSGVSEDFSHGILVSPAVFEGLDIKRGHRVCTLGQVVHQRFD